MDKKPSLIEKIRLQIITKGPLPPSIELKNYEKVLSGAANRILKMAEQQSVH